MTAYASLFAVLQPLAPAYPSWRQTTEAPLKPKLESPPQMFPQRRATTNWTLPEVYALEVTPFRHSLMGPLVESASWSWPVKAHDQEVSNGESVIFSLPNTALIHTAPKRNAVNDHLFQNLRRPMKQFMIRQSKKLVYNNINTILAKTRGVPYNAYIIWL